MQERIAISAFFATSYCTTSGDVELRYATPHSDLVLYRGQSICPIDVGAGKKLTLAAGQLKKLHQAAETNRVLVFGAAMEVSCGLICIAFIDRKDLDRFIKKASSMTCDRVAVRIMAEDFFDAEWDMYSREVQQSYHSHKRRATLDQVVND